MATWKPQIPVPTQAWGANSPLDGKFNNALRGVTLQQPPSRNFLAEYPPPGGGGNDGTDVFTTG